MSSWHARIKSQLTEESTEPDQRKIQQFYHLSSFSIEVFDDDAVSIDTSFFVVKRIGLAATNQDAERCCRLDISLSDSQFGSALF
mmetsp:Transcript_56303/g.148564  ORF Transcript_56303/g.148564 Transcript_56303/m.148564 type:complete len:85 (+) Transcript_56303:303-557(+)